MALSLIRGEEAIPGLVVAEMRYMEYIESPEGPALLLRPVTEFNVPNEPSIPSQTSTSEEAGRSIQLRAVQRISYKDGERVKSVDGLELIRTQLVLEIDKDTPQLAADIELMADETDPEVIRLQLVILESLVIRRDIAADQTQGSTTTRLLVADATRLLQAQLLPGLRSSLRRLEKYEDCGQAANLFAVC